MSVEIENLLKGIAAQEKIFDYKIEKADGSNKGDGYTGIITRVQIAGKDDENKDKVLNLIVKSASKSDALRTEAPIEHIFDREIYMYDTVFPLLRKAEVEKGLAPSDFTPKFFGGQMTFKNEALILENLREIGYKLYERRKPMDDNHVSLVMKEYGRFHALSFALKHQNPDKFKEVTEPMTDGFVMVMKKTNFLHNTCIKAQQSLDPNTDKEAIAAYNCVTSRLNELFDELLESVDKYSVILHGDCWTNNMMFKYEDGVKPNKVCFLDFQISRMGSPVLDLAYFFYACSSKDIINNLNYYMELYYDSFSIYLQQLGSDPCQLFPRCVLQEHWKKYAKFGLVMSALAIYAMFTEKDETTDLSAVADQEKVFRTRLIMKFPILTNIMTE